MEYDNHIFREEVTMIPVMAHKEPDIELDENNGNTTGECRWFPYP